jgi:hypothetical protein
VIRVAISNLAEAQRKLSLFRESVPRLVKIVQGKIVLDVFAGVIRRSPVDTGRFRANWHVTIGAPSAAYEEDARTGRPRRAGSSGPIPPRSGDTETARQVGASLLAMELGQAVYITNNTPYGWRLEEGFSPQAPQGVLLVTVLSVVERARQALNIEVSL